MPRNTLVMVIAVLLCGPTIGLSRQSGQESLEREAGAAGASARPQPTQRERRAAPQTAARNSGAGEEPIPIPIPPPTPGARRAGAAPAAATTTGNVATVVLSSLAIVLGLFFCVVWLSRRALPKASTSLSSDVLELLGRAPLASRHHLQLIRLGRRLLLVSVTPDHAETLTEITDPDELNHLTSLCRQQQPGSISDSFRQVLHQLGSASGATGQRGRGGRQEIGLAEAGERRRSELG